MRPRTLLACVCVLLLALVPSKGFAADRRVALVIGNAAYKNAPPLANTIADATGIAQLFRKVGFEAVILRTDLGVVDFKRVVRQFLLTAEGADIAVVYYAGHGVEIGGTNYLVPTDAKLSHDYDADDEAVSLDHIIWALQSVKRLRLIILDACRDNPFAARMRSVAVRAMAGGRLGQPIDIAADTLVAYAAKAGSQSFDGDGPNSPYATALLRHLAEPGVDIRIALGQVRDDVLAMTGGRQEPFIYGSLGGATIALVPSPATTRIQTPPAIVPTAAKAVPTVMAQPVTPSSREAPGLPARSGDPLACSRDERHLEQLRAEPVRERIVEFATELTCPRLRMEVQRLLESVGATDQAGSTSTRPPSREQQANARPAPGPPARFQDPALTCSRDERRLEELRAEPARDQIVRFAKELACQRLRTQLQRLLESVGATNQGGATSPPWPAPRQQAEVSSAPDGCAHDVQRLQRLRAAPNRDEVQKFDRELSCERLRPQLLRLRESLGL